MMLGIVIFVVSIVVLVSVLVKKKSEVVLRRPAVLTLLGLGIVSGAASAAHGYRWYSDHGWARHEAFQNKVADICTQSALRVYDQRSGGGRK
jgi:hypothetical protein